MSKKTFDEIRRMILTNLGKRPMTNMEVSRLIKCDYRTIDRHVVWLIGMDKIERIKKNDKMFYKIK